MHIIVIVKVVSEHFECYEVVRKDLERMLPRVPAKWGGFPKGLKRGGVFNPAPQFSGGKAERFEPFQTGP